MLQRAHKLDPANDKILVDLGSACAKAYDFAAAQRWFDEAVRVSTTPVPALTAVGHAWLEVRNFEAAQACFERLLQEKQVPLVTFIRLSEIYIRRRRLEDAAQMTDRALRLYGPVDGVVAGARQRPPADGAVGPGGEGVSHLTARTNGDPRCAPSPV